MDQGEDCDKISDRVAEKLDELTIVPSLPVILLKDADLPLSLNPFYAPFQTDESKWRSRRAREEIFGASCRCRTAEDKTRLILNATKFKSKRRRSGGGGLIQEPRLKEMAKCLHECIKVKTEPSAAELSDELQSHLTLEGASGGAKDHHHRNGRSTFGVRDDNQLDFRALIDKTTPRQTSLSDDELYTRKSFKGFRSKVLRRSRFKMSKADDESTSLTASTQANASNSSPSSCSQQARLNIGCDVTINEIASYFELLYIPKKMSSMAQNMYL